MKLFTATLFVLLMMFTDAHGYDNATFPVVGLQVGYPNIAEVHGGIGFNALNIKDIPVGPLAIASVGDAYSMIGIGIGGYDIDQMHSLMGMGCRIEFNYGYIYDNRMSISSNQEFYGVKLSIMAYHFGVLRGKNDGRFEFQFGIQLPM